MELLSINDINRQFLLYKDLRSVEGFLKNAGINILKLGRGRWILKESWDTFVAGLINIQTKSVLKYNKYKPTGKAEKQFSKDLQKYLTEL